MLFSVAHCTPNADLDGANEKDLLKNACKAEYAQLEECLADTQRNWAKCQKQLLAFKACGDAAKKKQLPPGKM
jgi:hypothetical protein